MTYRIIEGELYHAIPSAVCSAGICTCHFNSQDRPWCACQTVPNTLHRPCTSNSDSVVFFTDEEFVKYLSGRITG